MISKDHVIKVLWQHYGSEHFRVIHHTAKFGGYRHCDSRDIMVLVCQVISHDHVTQELHDVTLKRWGINLMCFQRKGEALVFCDF